MEAADTTPPSKNELNHMFRQGIHCVGGPRGVVYVTVPITSGYRLFKLLHEQQCSADDLRSRHPELFRTQVFEPNMTDAESWAEQARNAFRGRVVLDPSRLVRPGWSQDDYNGLWDEVIDEFVDIVIATPRWAFSRGARKEIEKALRTSRRVTDLTGQDYPRSALLDDDNRAREELRSWGWSEARIAAELPPLDDIFKPKPGERPREDESAWHDTMAWVHEDLSWYTQTQGEARIIERDDVRMQRALNDADGWGPAKIQTYWRRAIDHSITTPRGRVELGSLVGASVGMLRSLWRLHGPLTSHADMLQPNWRQRHLPPSTSALERPDLYHGQVATDVWTWIQQERLAMRRSITAASDDRATQEFADGDPSCWEGELWGEHWEWAVNRGLGTQEGKYRLGQFVVASFRLLESTTRLYGLPLRITRDATRD